MRRSLAVFALLLASSCAPESRRGDEQQDSSASAPSNAVSEFSAETASPEERAAAGPNVSPTAAPGVAFNYRYAFRLPGERVSQVLEHHASQCEALGPNRCRITGMHYEVVNERDITGRLNFKLEPSIARRFGREGVEAVTRAEGMLVESEISGTDVGTSIRQAGRSIAQMTEDLRRVEAQLARRGLSSVDRSNLEYEAQQLRASIRAAQENRQEAQESLATTPMTFQYGSGDLVPGFDTHWPMRNALEQAGNNFIGGLAILFIILVTILPWATLALLVWLALRWFRRRGTRTARPETPAVETDE